MAKFNEYTVKATPEDADTLMLYDAASKTNKLSPFSGIWNWMVNKLTNAVINNLQTSNKTVVGALNELNSKALIAINNNVNDWNSISQQGIYFGSGNAVNSPITGASVWIDAIVMASNGNISYLNLLAVSTTGILLCRRMSKGTWENWNIINSNPKA